ncbi:phosphatase PAP2 family protein, partial [Nocardia grenadensis]
WCGWQLWRHGRGRGLRVLGVLYPLFVVVVVLGTANHYLADVVAGLAVMGLGALASPWVLRGVDRVRNGVAMRRAGSEKSVQPIEVDQRNAA